MIKCFGIQKSRKFVLGENRLSPLCKTGMLEVYEYMMSTTSYKRQAQLHLGKIIFGLHLLDPCIQIHIVMLYYL